MKFIGIEEIQPYTNFYEFKLFKYDDAIELGNDEKYICNLKFIKLDIDSVYEDKGFEKNLGYIVIENLNEKLDISLEELEESVKTFIFEEIPLLELNKKSINVILGLKK